MSVDYLNSNSIDWALHHLQRYGTQIIFPIPFEYEAFSYDWPSFKKQIENMEYLVTKQDLFRFI